MVATGHCITCGSCTCSFLSRTGSQDGRDGEGANRYTDFAVAFPSRTGSQDGRDVNGLCTKPACWLAFPSRTGSQDGRAPLENTFIAKLLCFHSEREARTVANRGSPTPCKSCAVGFHPEREARIVATSICPNCGKEGGQFPSRTGSQDCRDQ